MLSKGQGSTMGTCGQLIRALDMDHRAEEAHKFWEKRIGIDLHSVPWQLCKSMIAIYYRNNMLERLIKVHVWLMCLQELQRYISISVICPHWLSMKYLSKFDLDKWTFSSSQLHVTYICKLFFAFFTRALQTRKEKWHFACRKKKGGGGEGIGERRETIIFAFYNFLCGPHRQEKQLIVRIF